MKKKYLKYILIIIGYLAFMSLTLVMKKDVKKYALMMSCVMVMILSSSIGHDLRNYLNKKKIMATGTEYIAVIVGILQTGYTLINSGTVSVNMFVRVRYFDKDHELRDEWINTHDIYEVYKDTYTYGRTVRICENDTDICLVSEKAENLALPETSDGSVVSDREMIMDKNIPGTTKKPLPLSRGELPHRRKGYKYTT